MRNTERFLVKMPWIIVLMLINLNLISVAEGYRFSSFPMGYGGPFGGNSLGGGFGGLGLFGGGGLGEPDVLKAMVLEDSDLLVVVLEV